VRRSIDISGEGEIMRKYNRALGIGVLAVAVVTLAACSSKSATPNAVGTTTTTGAAATTPTTVAVAKATVPPTTAAPAGRHVQGTAVTLGAGTFTGGKDVAVGLYDVTPGSGQSGNFTVSGTDSYNEILGDAASLGVPMVRAQISTGDQIQIASLSAVTFTPVSTPYSTSHTTTNIYAGTWTVGQDVGAGRYVATPGPGQSGNFIVSGNDSYNEILGGDASTGGVPSLTISISKGDVIAVSGLSQVTLTAQ
jgi:hypothetical protein